MSDIPAYDFSLPVSFLSGFLWLVGWLVGLEFWFLFYVCWKISFYAFHLTFSSWGNSDQLSGNDYAAWQVLVENRAVTWNIKQPQGISLAAGQEWDMVLPAGEQDAPGSWWKRILEHRWRPAHTWLSSLTERPGLYLSVYPGDFSRFLGCTEHYRFSCSVGISCFHPTEMSILGLLLWLQKETR